MQAIVELPGIEEAIDRLHGEMVNVTYADLIINHYLHEALSNPKLDVASVYFNCRREQYLESYRVVGEFADAVDREIHKLRRRWHNLSKVSYIEGHLLVEFHE